MTEHAILVLLGVASSIAIAGPILQLVISLAKQAFPRAIVLRNEHGDVLGRISPETVQKSSKSELVQLHERLRRSRNVSVEAA